MQNVNQFAMSKEKGQVDLKSGTGPVLTVEVAAAQSTPLKPGQCVRIVDDANAIPRVLSVADDDDDVFGVVTYDLRRPSIPVGGALEVAYGSGTVVLMQASAAIARYAEVMPVVTGEKVATATTGKRIIGRALDKATAADQLIRVLILLPSPLKA